MGGKLFKEENYKRMVPAIYSMMQERCQSALREYFEFVGAAIEAPEKEDHGDVDILVACPKEDMSLTEIFKNPEVLMQALGATKFVAVESNKMIHFSLPWPMDHANGGDSGVISLVQGLHLDMANNASGTNTSNPVGTSDGKPLAVQVDINVYRTPEEFEYAIFNTGHGDFWNNIIGHMVRYYGLKLSNKGLFLRNLEVEKFRSKKSRAKDVDTFLTADPEVILEFLGMDQTRWKSPFDSLQELFEYAATSRFFNLVKRTTDDESGSDDKEKKTPRDKEREKRPLVNRWQDYRASRREQGKFQESDMTTDNTREEAFEKFGVQEEYRKAYVAWKKNQQVQSMRDFIEREIPTAEEAYKILESCGELRHKDDGKTYHNGLLNRLMAIILHGKTDKGVIPSKPLRTNEGLFDEEAIKEFIAENKEELGRIAMGKDQAHKDEHNMKQT